MPRQLRVRHWPKNRSALELVRAAVGAGRLRPVGIRVIGLSDVPRAFEESRDGHVLGKIVVGVRIRAVKQM